MKTSEQINELAEALAQAQAEITNPEKNAKNPHFKSDYTDLGGVLATIRPAFSKVGLSIIQSPRTMDNGNIAVTTRIMHKSGQWIEDVIDVPMQKGNNLAQEAGKVITYLRRYSAAAFAGVHQADPDAQGAEGEVVNMRFDQATLDRFGAEMREAMEREDYMTVGRSLANKDLKDIWEAANQGTQRNGGQFDSKHKKLQSDLNKSYLQEVERWATEMMNFADDEQADAVMEIWNDLDDVDKTIAWAQMNESTKTIIRRERKAA